MVEDDQVLEILHVVLHLGLVKTDVDHISHLYAKFDNLGDSIISQLVRLLTEEFDHVEQGLWLQKGAQVIGNILNSLLSFHVQCFQQVLVELILNIIVAVGEDLFQAHLFSVVVPVVRDVCNPHVDYLYQYPQELFALNVSSDLVTLFDFFGLHSLSQNAQNEKLVAQPQFSGLRVFKARLFYLARFLYFTFTFLVEMR